MLDKNQLNNYLSTLKVKEGTILSLDKCDTLFENRLIDKLEAKHLLKKGIKQLTKMQDKLYADNRYSVLIVLQAMDAAGKDGAIKHVMSGFNPQGVKVTSFKAPSVEEKDHDYFWRHYKALPGRGEIGIFNRSHYENVLVTRVHPEFIMGENIPGITTVKDIDESFWRNRFEQINRFEKNLYENGTRILKFFLHLSKEEQKVRFLERIDNPTKNWKLSAADAKERKLWDKYQRAYAEMISATSKEYAPWYILPADDKPLTRICIATAIHSEFKKLNLKYPELSEEDRQKLLQAKKELLSE
ncbi:MAG: polyphosphate kinase 2 family protein [Draconibacterium sp.]